MAQGAPTVRPAALRRLANPNPRPTAHRRGYGRAWQRARIGFLQQHPLCTHCAQQGITRAATVVDHIQPHHGEAARFWVASLTSGGINCVEYADTCPAGIARPEKYWASV